MNKLKVVYREGLPETNSSSSHSVVITRSESKDIDKSYIPIREDGTIVIPRYDGEIFDFGRSSFEAHNDFITKTVFVISLSIGCKPLTKFLKLLKETICSFTGAKDVIFEAIEEYNNQITRCLSSEDYIDYYNKDINWILSEHLDTSFGTVDHESLDLRDEVFENKDTLKNFLFNPDSWLFLGSDGSDMEAEIKKVFQEYYKKSSKTEYNTASIDFGYNIGRVDYILYNYPNKNFIISDIIEGKDNLVSYLVFDNVNKEYIFVTAYDVDILNDNNRYLQLSGLFRNNHYYVVCKDGIYLYYCTEQTRNFVFNKGVVESNYRPCPINNGILLEKILDSNPKLIEGKDWIRLRINLNIKDFGVL